MFKAGKNYVSLALSEDTLKVAHLKISVSEQKLIGIIKRDVRGMPEGDLPKVIQSAMGDLNIKKPYALCTVPSHVVTTKNIEIPSLDPEEIKSIIDLQAGRHTPYAREEILIGYISIGVFQRNYTKVLLIIVNREVIKKQLSVFESAGIRVNNVLFGPEGISRFYARALNVKEEDTPVGIIDVAGQTTDFIIEFNKTVATSRNIPVGSSHLYQEGETARDKLIGELVKSLEAYQNEDINKIPQMYILTRDDAGIRELQPILQEKLNAEIRIMSYSDHLQVDEAVKLKLTSEYKEESFLNVIAGAAVINDIRVDLIPDEVKTRKSIEEKGRELIKLGALGTVIFCLICGIFFSKIYFKSVHLNKLKTEYLKKRKAVALDRVAQKTRIIRGYLNSRMVSLDVMKEIYEKTPAEIYLRNISLDEKGTVNLQGTSESMSRVFNFVTYMEGSELFKSVKTKSTSAKKERGKDVAVFDIEFTLESTMSDGEEEPPPEARRKNNPMLDRLKRELAEAET